MCEWDESDEIEVDVDAVRELIIRHRGEYDLIVLSRKTAQLREELAEADARRIRAENELEEIKASPWWGVDVEALKHTVEILQGQRQVGDSPKPRR